MSRIELSDNMLDVATKMSEGNPGALTAIMECFTKGPGIDPDDIWKGLGPIIMLDNWEIYGSHIYILWNDICKRNTRDFLLLIRACQLGYLSHTELQKKSREDYGSFPAEKWAELNEKVCNFLPKFQKTEVVNG
jgi:hypothetical protein